MDNKQIEEAVEEIRKITEGQFAHDSNYMEALDTLLSLAQLFLSVKGVPQKQKLTGMPSVDRVIEAENKIIDEFTACLAGRMEEIEDELGKIEIPLDTNPMYVEETKNPAVIKLKSRYVYIISQTITAYLTNKEG